MTRLTDEELDALLAAHPHLAETNDTTGKLEEWCDADDEGWPCKTVRLATEVRDLRAVLETVRTWRNAADEIKRFDAEKVNAVAQTVLRVREALARYEEGGR